MDSVHLSAEAHARLSQELAWRSDERRREISQWIERAREHGDIRENADFDAAKNEQGLNEARVRHLDHMLKDAVIVENASTGTIGPGSVVEIRMDQSAETSVYLVGSIEERHETLEVLSASSPLGQVLIGAVVGDTVEFAGPRRVSKVEVVTVRTLTEI